MNPQGNASVLHSKYSDNLVPKSVSDHAPKRLCKLYAGREADKELAKTQSSGHSIAVRSVRRVR